MSFDELIKGLSVFSQGVKELAISHAANDANEQLNDLNQKQLNREEQLKAQSAIGNNLALRLQSVGANASEIAATAQRLAPSAGEMYQSEEAMKQQQSSQKFSMGQQERLFEQQKILQDMKNRALLGKGDKALQKTVMGLGDKFNKRPDVKPLLDNMPKIDDALEKIKETKGQMGATAMINLAQLGLIRGAAGRVNEKEIEGANESQAKRNQLWKKMGLEATGEVPMSIQEFWLKVMGRAKDNIHMHLKEKARGYAQEVSDLSDQDIDAAKVEQAILKGHNLYEPAARSAAKGSVEVVTPPQGITGTGLPPGFSKIGQ